MTRSLFIGILFVVVVLIAAAGCTGSQGGKTVVAPSVTITVPDGDATQKTFVSLPQAPLNESERADIIYLQEEEKLVHDLNNAFSAQHPDVPVFLSIANASKVYMTADNVILQRYTIPNPEKDAAGAFGNQKFQQMYTAGVNNGSMSSLGALTSSAMLEDMHIADLEAAIGRTDNADVIFIYRQELTASRNNLRALSQWIAAYGSTYSPTYISQDYYNNLISTPAEPVPAR